MTDNLASFPVDPVLTGITLAYKNESYIADSVLPRVGVDKQAFKYLSYPIAESFLQPDTRVGRRSRPNEVDLTASETTAITDDYGLDDPIPVTDIMQAPDGRNPVDRAVMQLTDYIAMGREKRVADLVFAAGSYASGYKTQLSGTSQWSDFTNSNPLDNLQTGIDAALMRPNVLVLGQAVWSKLRMHPKVVQAVTGQSVTGGMIMRQQLAQLLEVEEVLVGSSWLNTAKKGQTATLARIWGKHALLFYRNLMADTRNGLTFGFTGEFGSRVSGQEPDTKIGLRGGTRVRVGESLKELIVAPAAAYFIQDAVA